jgi:hypothetical protein
LNIPMRVDFFLVEWILLLSLQHPIHVGGHHLVCLKSACCGRNVVDRATLADAVAGLMAGKIRDADLLEAPTPHPTRGALICNVAHEQVHAHLTECIFY